jgi:kynurenine formamidase
MVADLSFWLTSPMFILEGAAPGRDEANSSRFRPYPGRGPRRGLRPRRLRVQKILLGAGVLIYEGLTDLHLLTRTRVKIVAAPLKLGAMEAAPARIFAIED